MKKRGQLLAQPLVMIFAMIVGALILAWGLYEVYKLVDVATDIQVADYITTLKKDVQRYYYFEPGSSAKFKVSMPSDYDWICFVNREGTPTQPLPGNRPFNYAHNFILGRKNDNAFAYSKDGVIAYYVPYLRTSTDQVLCLKNGMQLTLTSKGTYVEVT